MTQSSKLNRLVPWSAAFALAAIACPAPGQQYFTYQVVTKTGDAGITSFDGAPSISNDGFVAFVGATASGEMVFFDSFPAVVAPERCSFTASADRDYFLAQINDEGFVLSRDRVAGSPPFTFIRLWNINLPGDHELIAEGSGDSDADFASVLGNASVNNSGEAVFAALELDTSNPLLAKPGSVFGFDTFALTGSSTFPMISDAGRTVVRRGSAATDDLIALDSDLDVEDTIADGGAHFAEVGRNSSISEDGRTVVFYGDLSAAGAAALNTRHDAMAYPDGTSPETAKLAAGKGIFVAAKTTAGWIIQRAAGVSGNGVLDPGETFNDTDHDGRFDAGEADIGPFASFDIARRTGANTFGLPQYHARIVFWATRTDGNPAIYSATVIDGLGGPEAPADEPRAVQVAPAVLVARAGQAISPLGTLSAVEIHDPVDTGQHIAFLATGGSAQGVVVATLIPDTDKDGLLDDWETGGIDADVDGTVDYTLPESPNKMKKDLYVEIDAMTNLGPAILFDGDAIADITAAGMSATGTTIDAVMQSFLKSPVTNPDGSTGVRLHVQLDNTTLTPADWGSTEEDAWAAFNVVKAAEFGTPAEGGDPLKIAARKLAFRYCVWARKIHGDSSSGLAELPGNDFMIVLGQWDRPDGSGGTIPGGTDEEQQGTFMHELGHTLGLRHGGGQYDPFGDSRFNRKPNYLSVMNYTWQTPSEGFTKGWVLDYSRSKLPTLDENALTESAGLGGRAGKFVPLGPPGTSGTASLQFESGPVDYNEDGDEADTGVARDLNHIFSSGLATPGGVLDGFADWPALVYDFRTSADFADGTHATRPTLESLTSEEAAAYDDIPDAEACRPDCNGDGRLNINDFICFQAEWRKKSAYGDYNGDGRWNINDYIAFQADWRKTTESGGCP